MPSKVDRKCRLCPTVVARENRTGLCRKCFEAERRATQPSERLKTDQERRRTGEKLHALEGKYKAALETIDRQSAELGWIDSIREGIDSTFKIEPKHGSGTSEATPVLVASDWHSEEIVKASQVSGINEFNPEIFDKRSTKFFQSGLRLIRLLNQDVKIDNVVLALLGDFITGDIHGAENAESNAMLPIDALINVQNKMVSGIEFLLEHSKFNLILPTKVGNHTRTTQRVRFGSEQGHSLETLMYVFLASHFRNNPRVRFVIDDGYHTYLNIYDQTVRFHHGHALTYAGGVGGLFIPTYKAIHNWNDGRRADLDVFGHFHQTKDGGSFLCNGSLIGYNAFALSIKAAAERPSQTLFLMDKRRGRTCTWPVLVGHNEKK